MKMLSNYIKSSKERYYTKSRKQAFDTAIGCVVSIVYPFVAVPLEESVLGGILGFLTLLAVLIYF